MEISVLFIFGAHFLINYSLALFTRSIGEKKDATIRGRDNSVN